jgi:TolB-like protein/DNA-binding winged helix-turn-helix (wHTH) protein/Tfp pilus assembly protein PilF
MRFAFGVYELEPESRTLLQRGERVPVEPKVFDLLAYLIEHRSRVVSTNELLDTLWPGVSITPAALTRAVQKARRAVRDDGEHQAVLRTEHGHGFRFVADVSVIDAPATALRTPAGFQTRWVVAAGVATLPLVAVVAWLLVHPVAEPAPTRSVAVLPLVDPSGDPEYFADGMTETLTTNLAKISALKVIARTSVDRLDPNLSVREIGSKLGVTTVLEGRVQRAGDRVRVNVQLIDCETEVHLWAETYDRELSVANFFAIQSEIATKVADALRAALSPEEQDRLTSVPTENLAAYEAYLLGRQRLARETIAALVEAVDYFQQAIDLDPGFALAYVGLADSYSNQVFFGGLAREEGLAKAQAAVDKALAQDDQLGEAYTSLAGFKQERRDYEGAEAMYRRALELNPNYATTYYHYGSLLRHYLGRYEEALALHRKAAELDPLSARIICEVGADLESLGRFDEALARYQRAIEVDPGYANAYTTIAAYYRTVPGRLDEAVVWLAKGVSLDPGSASKTALLGLHFLELGDFDRGESWIERSLELGPESFWPDLAMHNVHMYRGDEGAALDYARRVLALDPKLVPALLRDHELRAGRNAEARALYEKGYPEFRNEGNPMVDGSNWGAAIGLAVVFSRTGEQEHADLLLNRSFQHIQTLPRMSGFGYGIADVNIYALRGEKQKALSALRQAIDEGWRSGWRHRLKHDLTLESLHDEPEYQAMVAEIEADLAAQLARVHEMERNGELAEISRSEASLH